MKVFTIFLIMLCAAGLGCLPTSSPAEANLNQEFRLKFGQQVAIRGEDVAIRFQSVLEDSRCPKNAQCVQAGQARIAIVIRRGNTDSEPMTLTINPPQAQNQITYQGYTVQLKALDPFPETPEKKAAPQDYEAALVVSKS